MRNGITTYKDLVNENAKVDKKESKLSSVLRYIVASETIYYLNLRNTAETIWSTLSEDDREEVRKTGAPIYRIIEYGT